MRRTVSIITKADFDAAVKQPWSMRTCIVAQWGKRVHEARRNTMNCDIDKVASIMRTFDRYFKKPGDEKKPFLQYLRDSLPCKITQ